MGLKEEGRKERKKEGQFKSHHKENSSHFKNYRDSNH
jgi:hypothetical protein